MFVHIIHVPCVHLDRDVAVCAMRQQTWDQLVSHGLHGTVSFLKAATCILTEYELLMHCEMLTFWNLPYARSERCMFPEAQSTKSKPLGFIVLIVGTADPHKTGHPPAFFVSSCIQRMWQNQSFATLRTVGRARMKVCSDFWEWLKCKRSIYFRRPLVGSFSCNMRLPFDSLWSFSGITYNGCGRLWNLESHLLRLVAELLCTVLTGTFRLLFCSYWMVLMRYSSKNPCTLTIQLCRGARCLSLCQQTIVLLIGIGIAWHFGKYDCLLAF